MATKKKILVVGGGLSGISSIKAMKEEGLEPVCYEKTSKFGGTWCYREHATLGLPSIMPTTIINHSKEMGSISDFPASKEYPNYMRHNELLKLGADYGNQFDCFRHITYNREVTKVKRSADYDETGKWNATIKNTETGEITEEVFDGVSIGVGQFTYPKMPQYPGMEKYRGIIRHTHSVKDVEEFKGKKIVIVGIGCSGIDAAVEISSVASQVYLSTRSGAWIMPRVGPHGLPFDYCMLRRYVVLLQNILGWKFLSWYLEKFKIENNVNHSLYKLKPPYHALASNPVTNDILPAKLISGSVVMRKDIKCFTETGVIFNGEASVTEADAVIMATGYKWAFPFLEDGIFVTEEGRINLYKCVFPPHLKHATIAIIGFFLPFGPGFPLGELQCRWAASVFRGNCQLPTKEVMMERIKKRHEENLQRYVPSDKITVQVDFIQYADELAEEIGVRPNMWKLLFTDPVLFRALAFGPSLSYQYRLEGPHKWDGARKAILTSTDRVRYPLMGEKQKSTKNIVNFKSYIKYIVIFLIMAFWLMQTKEPIKRYLLMVILPYLVTWKGFYKRYIFSLLMLPFFVPWEGFTSSYFITLFVPLVLSLI